MANEKERPKSWKELSATFKRQGWRLPFIVFQWGCEWAAWWLRRVALLEVLEYVGKLSLLVALLVWIYPGCRERKQAVADATKSRHYVAWQTINSAVGKPGDAGRSDALEDLNRDGVSLDGISMVGGASFRFLTLTNAHMRYGNFSSTLYDQVDFSRADLFYSRWGDMMCRDSDFRGTDFTSAVFTNAYFDHCNFDVAGTGPNSSRTRFCAATFTGSSPLGSSPFIQCSFVGADFSHSSWEKASFNKCNFAQANLAGVTSFGTNDAIYACNLYGATNASPEFLIWAYQQPFVVTNITSREKWDAWSPPRLFMPVTSPAFFAWASNQWTAFTHTNDPQAWLAWSRANLRN